ncbi:MAG: recombinase RecT [Oscillospiraceae bacterium]|nr:recombinase RecT [Oscillospiraceae bacterium]
MSKQTTQAEAINLAAITYRDLLDLVYRTGMVRIIQTHTVHENDRFQYRQGDPPVLRHDPAETDRGSVTHYYAMYQTMDGSCGFAVMSREDIVPEGIPEDIVADAAKKVVTLRALRQCLKAG